MSLISTSPTTPSTEPIMSAALAPTTKPAALAPTLVSVPLAPSDDAKTSLVHVTDKDGVTRELTQARPDELDMLAAQYATTSVEHESITPQQLAEVAARGRVLVLRDDSGALIGCAQILLDATDEIDLDKDEAYCYGSFVVKDFQGCGHLELLHRAQEKLARSVGKTHITVAERPDSLAGLTARLRAGFRVVDYCSSHCAGDWPCSARLLLRKSLRTDGEPFVEDEHRERLVAGLASRTSAMDVTAVAGTIDEIAVEFSRSSRSESETELDNAKQNGAEVRRRREITRAAEVLIDAGYVGIGWTHDTSGPAEGAFVYRRRGRPPTRTPGRMSVFDEYSLMREVVVNYDSFVADITPEDAINQVAVRNIGKVDALAQLDEYREFVAALEREGIRIVRNGARGANGRFACFARDSALIAGETAFIAHMARRQRQPESKTMSYLFRSRPHVDLRRYHGAHLEGGDILLERPNRIIAGIGQRTNDAGVDALQAALPGFEIIRVRHADLHLDVLFTIVGERVAVAYEPGLPADFLGWLETQRYELVLCHPDEQPTLGCNVLAVDNRRIIAAAENVNTNAALASHVDVIPVKMPNIVMDGGGPRCMACPVRRDGAR